MYSGKLKDVKMNRAKSEIAVAEREAKGRRFCGLLIRLMIILTLGFISADAMAEAPVAKKIFIFGDSMTGWMAERLQAYGEKNGFEVGVLVWDGATIKKYGNNTAALSRYIKAAKPDAVFVCLGMNEMGAKNPSALLGTSLNKILSTIGDTPVIWIGPCSWPAHPQWGGAINRWLEERLGATHYFNSLGLKIPRQSSTNPHPTRKGINTWTDDVVKWIEKGDAAIRLPGYAKPAKDYARPKIYTYRRMKAGL